MQTLDVVLILKTDQNYTAYSPKVEVQKTKEKWNNKWNLTNCIRHIVLEKNAWRNEGLSMSKTLFLFIDCIFSAHFNKNAGEDLENGTDEEKKREQK